MFVKENPDKKNLYIFLSKSINNLLRSIFKNCFILSSEITATTQSHRQLINYLSLRIELTAIVKTL